MGKYEENSDFYLSRMKLKNDINFRKILELAMPKARGMIIEDPICLSHKIDLIHNSIQNSLWCEFCNNLDE